jgi:hypothetical protein
MSSCGVGASNLLTAGTHNKDTQMLDRVFATAFKLRVGASLLPAHVAQQRAADLAEQLADPLSFQSLPPGVEGPAAPPAPTPLPCQAEKCDRNTDVQGGHAFRCECRKAGTYPRHNEVRDVLVRFSREMRRTTATASTQMDAHFKRKAGNDLGPGGLSADGHIITRNADGTNTSVFIDVTVVSTKLSLSRKEKRIIGSSAAEATRNKFKLYNKNYEMSSPAAVAKGSMLPLAFETSGLMSEETHKFVQHLARDNRFVNTKADYGLKIQEIMQCVSVALQRGNARMIHHWQAVSFAPAAAVQPEAAQNQ